MGVVWDRTAEFLSDNIAAVIPIALLAFFVPTSIQGNFAALMQGGSSGLQLGLSLVQLAFALLSMWGSLAIAALALDLGQGRAAGALALRRLPAVVLISIVLLVGALLLLLPVPIVLGAAGVDLMAAARGEGAMTIPPGVAGFLALYYLVYVLFVLWAAARLMLVTPVILREGKMFGAIGQSWRLTRGYTLKIIGVLILFAVVAIVSVLAATTVFGSIFALVAGGDGAGVSLATVLTSIVQGAVQTAFMVIAPAFTAKLYLALSAEAGLRGAASPA